MKTTDGSFAVTDGGLNIPTRITNRLRVGAQAYSRNIGDFGNGRVFIIPGSDRLFDRHQPGIVMAIIPNPDRHDPGTLITIER